MTLYDELNLKKGASADQIKDNYRKLSKKYHPDLAGKNYDKEKWNRIAHAYFVLSDPQRREQYDLHGDDQTGPVESLDDLAIKILIDGLDAATSRVINKGEYDFNLISMIGSHIAESKEQATSHLGKSKKALKDLWLFKKKFQKTPGRTEILLDVVKDKIHKMRQTKAHIEKSLLIMDAAVEMLEQIEFDYTEEEAASFLEIGRNAQSVFNQQNSAYRGW